MKKEPEIVIVEVPGSKLWRVIHRRRRVVLESVVLHTADSQQKAEKYLKSLKTK